jgi:hypothetical protein
MQRRLCHFFDGQANYLETWKHITAHAQKAWPMIFCGCGYRLSDVQAGLGHSPKYFSEHCWPWSYWIGIVYRLGIINQAKNVGTSVIRSMAAIGWWPKSGPAMAVAAGPSEPPLIWVHHLWYDNHSSLVTIITIMIHHRRCQKTAEINYCACLNKAILRMLDRLQDRIHLQCTMARGVCALRALVRMFFGRRERICLIAPPWDWFAPLSNCN